MKATRLWTRLDTEIKSKYLTFSRKVSPDMSLDTKNLTTWSNQLSTPIPLYFATKPRDHDGVSSRDVSRGFERELV